VIWSDETDGFGSIAFYLPNPPKGQELVGVSIADTKDGNRTVLWKKEE